MIDIDALHSALQFPTLIVTSLVAVLLGMRAHAIRRGDVSAADADVILALAAFVGLGALKLGYWSLRWVLRAADLHATSDRLNDWPLFPIACNIGIALAGIYAIWRVGLSTLGRRATPVVAGAATLTLVLAVALQWR